MKKLLVLLALCSVIFNFSACGRSFNAANTENESGNAAKENTPANVSNTGDIAANTPLVAYFTYSENIGDTSGMNVDAITSASVGRSTDNTEGNLQVMAQAIREQTDADVYSILVQEPYDPDYDVMRDRAYEELDNAAFPELQPQAEDLSGYDIIYLGTPVWSGNMPRPVASFLHANDLTGKTIVPFGINLGSGFGTIIQEIKELCPDANVLDGLTIRADTPNAEVRTEIADWLSNLQI